MLSALFSIIIFLFSLTLIALAVLFYKRQQTENFLVDQALKEFGHENTSLDWRSAVDLSQKIRAAFNTDKQTFKSLNFSRQAFLRDDCSTLLTHREGLCGEGTRVLVCLFNRLGVDATRVTLFTRWLHPSHTLVSIQLNGEEYFIDSINSQTPFNDYVNNTRLSSDDFNIMGHVSNVNDRRELKKQLRDKAIDETLNELVLSKYLFYSYDAIPWTKLAKLARMETRVISLKRPHKMVSAIAEKPNLIKANLSLAAGALTFIFWLAI